MKYLKVIAVTGLLLLTGCQSKETDTPAQVLVPQGATAMSVLPLYGTDTIVDTVAGTDVISAEMVKTDSAYDIIIAPVNLGTKLLEKESSQYYLQAVITWGNLYVVGSDDTGAFAAFGEEAVPGKILSVTIPNTDVVYYNSAQDVQAQMLSGKATTGLLAEPAATATIAKAKEQGIDLSVQMDLQEAYKKTYSSSYDGYPQAAIFVKKGSEDKVKDVLNSVETFDNETVVKDPNVITSMIDDQGLLETIGVPSSAIAQKTWDRQNIKYVDAQDVQDELTTFLRLFKITFNESMLVK